MVVSRLGRLVAIVDESRWLEKWMFDSTSRACIVRVTNQCNDKCRHCSFRSGPNCIGQLSVESCEEINAWVPRTSVVINIMGGEFSILDNYPSILVALAKGRKDIRLITNGFWAHDNILKFFNAMRDVKNVLSGNLEVAVSSDSWHRTRGASAKRFLKDISEYVEIVETSEIFDDDVVPIGRAWDNNIVTARNYRCACEQMCNMIITEDGMLCKCPFGYFTWKHFSETTWEDAKRDILLWREEMLEDGMNCNNCMEKARLSNVDSGTKRSLELRKVT